MGGRVSICVEYTYTGHKGHQLTKTNHIQATVIGSGTLHSEQLTIK